ncbi:DUF4349 domain-containing protein [Cellulomonas sp. S1-8]|uniref:DUF4349 domain-containing protein n=1 Tax=Cellulomonas sp. S1-8 TaxID=2904790 RepID=UPI002243C4AF|nr:DUF4349 domain-containing protein [Cellulomonas sp. S1-8]UZN01989.1 DUF4349 domain-containing protein [Cellulomonas sp. S1-8]
MTTRTRTLVATLAVLAALTGCSSGDSGSMSADEAADQPAGIAAEDLGGAVDGAAEGSDVADAAEDGTAATAQQVVQTARVTMVAEDPVATAQDVVRLVARLDGRVDARYERSGTDEDDPGSATLTVRVPSSAMASLPDDLGELGEVREFQVATEDVTNAAQDLDARIAATELSVARMADLLGRATTNSEIIEAESALTERQANLERLRSQRSRLADRVALSTVDIEVFAPERAPEPVVEEGPATFLDGLETGWTAFVATVRGVLVVVGVLLPWLVLAALVGAGVLWWRRRAARRATPVDPAATAPGAPVRPGPTPPGASPTPPSGGAAGPR